MKTSIFSLALLAWLMLVQSIANVASSTVAQEAEAPSTTEETVKETTNVTASTEPVQAEPNLTPDQEESTTDDAKSSGVDGKTEATNNATLASANAEVKQQPRADSAPAQAGPFIDLLGPVLLKLQYFDLDEKGVALTTIATNDALNEKRVVGLYFSADWCGPCRKFTPELVSFYNKINERMGRKDEFEIVWVSRCRDLNSFQQYFTQMNWLAIPPRDAHGERGRKLADMYKVKSIPSLVLLDEVGQVITIDARNKIPQDKTGIGFPWRNPIAHLYVTILPRSLRLMIKSHLLNLKEKLLQRVQTLLAVRPTVVNR